MSASAPVAQAAPAVSAEKLAEKQAKKEAAAKKAKEKAPAICKVHL